MKHFLKTICTVSAAAILLTSAIGADAAAVSPQNQPQKTSETLYSVGSVSKMYVTAAAMQLADKGKISLDAPVTEYLPEFRMKDEQYQKITVRMLMNHRSGLMGSMYSNLMLSGDRSTAPHDSLLQHLSTQRLKAEPDAYGAYCNNGFWLLERIVERVSGESFTDYIENHIAKPLGLHQTGTPWNAFQTAEQTPVFLGKTEYTPDYCMAIGSGGVLATASELCTFGSAFFTGNDTLISENAKKEMRTRADNDIYEDGFGLGWDRISDPDYDAAGVQILSKGGDLVFQNAELLVAPDEQICVAVTSAGGSSSEDTQLAKALMEIALEEKGIQVTHSQPVKKQTLDTVPEQYLQYAGLYANGSGLYQMTFPEQKMMLLECLTDAREEAAQFLYTDEDSFVRVYGKAVQPADSQTILRFAQREGITFLTEESVSGDALRGFQHTPALYHAQRVSEHPVSEEVQAAWNARDGKRYYLYGDTAFSIGYSDGVMRQLHINADGYVNELQIKDADRAESILRIPSSESRDRSDMEINIENGREFLSYTAFGQVFIAEDSIPDLPQNLTAAELTTGAAVWYNISSGSRKSVKLDIPERAAVYVYDKRDRLIYSSLMKNSGNTVPLPENGKIAFVGETGSAVGVE